MLPRLRALGRAEYVPTWEAMRSFTAQRDPATPDELWVVEHPPVYTLGVAGRRAHLLEAGAIPVVTTDRGGQVTYHGPGQVVVYVLVDLRRLGIYVKELVYRIEQAVVQTLDAHGVAGQRMRGAPGVYAAWPPDRAQGIDAVTRDQEQPLLAPPGAARDRSGPVFTGLAKIAALGIKVTRGCSYHGVSLNVAMDLTPYAHIDPCGYRGLAAVDLATLGVTASWSEVADHLAERLAQHFSR